MDVRLCLEDRPTHVETGSITRFNKSPVLGIIPVYAMERWCVYPSYPIPRRGFHDGSRLSTTSVILDIFGLFPIGHLPSSAYSIASFQHTICRSTHVHPLDPPGFHPRSKIRHSHLYSSSSIWPSASSASSALVKRVPRAWGGLMWKKWMKNYEKL